MKALIPLLILTSCTMKVDMKTDGSVSVIGPVAARADRLAVNAKTDKGELRVLLVNGNAEAVPLKAIELGEIIATGVTTVKVNKSNNALEATKSTNATNQAVNESNNALKAAQIPTQP